MSESKTVSVSGRWLITGAAGFIGSNLAAYLIKRGESVVGLDNFFSGKRSNIDRLEQKYGSRFLFIEGDILDGNTLKGAMEHCNNVAHLAAQVSVVRSIDFPDETHDINTTGFLRVVQAAAEASVNNLIYASSCAVYGDNDILPLFEAAHLRPMSPYAASKQSNEAYAAGLSVLAPRLNLVGLRFFNIFGEWQDAAGGYAAVIPKWIETLIEGQQPFIFGDGSATRDFCHVANVCEAIWQSALTGSAANGQVFNVASGVATRLDTLFSTIVSILEETGNSPVFGQPDFRPWREGEIIHSFGSPDKAAETLDFRVGIDLEEGLRRMLREEYNLPASVYDNVQ